jgi:hypothetical protein
LHHQKKASTVFQASSRRRFIWNESISRATDQAKFLVQTNFGIKATVETKKSSDIAGKCWKIHGKVWESISVMREGEWNAERNSLKYFFGDKNDFGGICFRQKRGF